MPLLRKLTIGAVRQKMGEILEEYRHVIPEDILISMNFVMRTKAPPRKPSGRGRPSIPERELARIANVYVERCEAGSRTPIVDCAIQFKISPSPSPEKTTDRTK